MGDGGDTYLNDIWNVYFHDPYDENWTTTSYVRTGSISNIEDFWHHHSMIKPQIHKGMFFIMREYVFPMWDAEENIKGGCLSLKVLKDNMQSFWEDLITKLLGETLLKEEHREHWNMVNGISTSPKKHFCIIKIWLKDACISNKDFYNILPSYYGDILYKSNIENIQVNGQTGSGEKEPSLSPQEN